MSDHELDVQTCLTTAIPRFTEHLGDLLGRYISYQNKTPPNSEQPTDLPRGLGVDVLAVVNASKILALEAKKTDHESAKLGKVGDSQVEFLKTVQKNPMFESYIVFDTLPDLRFDALQSYLPMRIAQLRAIAAVRPELLAQVQENFSNFIGPKASGMTMLDVVTRVVLEQPATKTDINSAINLLNSNLQNINNCVLWFFGDGYAVGLNNLELASALDELIQMHKSAEFKALMQAHNRLRTTRKTKSNSSAAGLRQAEDDYVTAKSNYLHAVCLNAQSLKAKSLSDGDGHVEGNHHPAPRF